MSRAHRLLAGLTTALALPALLLTGPDPAGAAPSPDAATDTAPHRSAGCGRPPPQALGQSVTRTLTSGGIERTYRLHLPDGYHGHRALPVLLGYHGRGNTGAGTEAFSGLTGLPAIVVHPDGVIGQGDGDRQAWQGAPYSAPGVDDVAFTHDLLDTLEAELCVDRGRVYATGKSNGGAFTALLACAASERVTAIAPVAAALYPHGSDCDPVRPVPVISFHGTEDVTIPYTGDVVRGLPDIAAWNAARAEANGCRPTPSTGRVEPDIAEYRWTGCDAGARVHHVAVEGGGHTWPGADSYSGGGHTTQTIEAHEEMWRFLSRHRLPAV
ncbi:PHB depolymerase family esterase [Nocardiopsis sp. MG754419]|uniref:alpha/beta hydrolase family esterase n=1 Tax=Nocardiopsis sp. MG754419 TaxID=2259865 RepID=UPI001BA83FA6|nr:poly(3-hydroxybutyrate) depolymerase [Nocardiopsis sp. MG754419]MBR8742299.1 poly(3-hydroxybutyrate) depolymerase [Nocardiopsis sp. MG754419]